MIETIEQRLAALEQRVDGLDAKVSERATTEVGLLEAMRQWARVTALGFYVETYNDGKKANVPISGGNAELMAQMFLDIAKAAAVSIMRVETGA